MNPTTFSYVDVDVKFDASAVVLRSVIEACRAHPGTVSKATAPEHNTTIRNISLSSGGHPITAV
jgi:hypothetical protein